ncbi:scopolin beta-glucosidase [Aureococcus anophagefferens]|nr:scopolin beta-glucosidase [Aureococcus anophagefferens]
MAPADLRAEAEAIVARMSLDERVAAVSGRDWWTTVGCARLGVKSTSPDPYVSGALGAAWVRGCQRNAGIGASVKHFAANNQESNRMFCDSRVDARTLRELYLPAFEMVVKEAKPWTVMTAYNQRERRLLQRQRGSCGVLSDEWGSSAAARQGNGSSGVNCSPDAPLAARGLRDDLAAAGYELAASLASSTAASGAAPAEATRDEALALVEGADAVVVVAGLPQAYEISTGQPWREEPSGISKADKLRDDKDAMMEMGKKGGRFELKSSRRLSINVDGCVNIEDFVNRIDMASRYPGLRLHVKDQRRPPPHDWP